MNVFKLQDIRRCPVYVQRENKKKKKNRRSDGEEEGE